MAALPVVAAAQSGPGTYILVDNRQVQYTGNLDIFDRGLTSKEGKGKKKVWQASEVYWARIGTHRYLPVGGFRVPAGLRFVNVEHGLAEILDSGRVSLLRYDYSVGGPVPTGPVGGFSTSSVSAYLLQVPDEEKALVIPMNRLSGKGSEFREMLAPYFATRADLLQQLEKGDVSRRNLAAFVHAYNTKQPFVAKPEDAEKE
ncbi:MAG: hypothetical protein JWP58_1413 [Hymenobacter sp.]|nr:hypothetical protein [Hymenobacter sp.]